MLIKYTRKKNHAKILVFLCAMALLLTLMYQKFQIDDVEQWEEPINAEPLLEQSSCHLPNYDAFEPAVLKYITSWPEIDCGQPQLPLTYARYGKIYINQSAVHAGNYKLNQLICSHQEITRRENNDYIINYGAKKDFTHSDTIEEFTVVSCYDKSIKKLIYESGHAKVKEVPEPLAERSRAAFKSGRTSVLILIIDSMSRLNFFRQLPKSAKFIEETLKGITLKGVTKVGDNTYPNVMAMLTGLATSAASGEIALAPFWGDENADRGYFDDLPAVWKNFSQQGYVTLFAEDFPIWGAFNTGKKGFKKPPTDYYMRPFWLAMDRQSNFISKDDRCYGHVPKHKFLFQYTEDFLAKMQEGKHSFFAFTFLSQPSHDHLNSVKVIDGDILEFLRRLKILQSNNTAIFIMGDHGQRMEDYRKTPIGRIEDRMPFVSISLPPTLNHLRENLVKNSRILSSWHDMYETLMDAAVGNTEQISNQLRYGHKGLSWFRPIPNNRTCLEIGIPREYCVCWKETELNKNDKLVVKAAENFVRLLNVLILDRVPKQCALLELGSVMAAQKLLPLNVVNTNNEHRVTLLRLMVNVKPSGAILEGTVQEKSILETSLVGGINRLNLYGNQSVCVSDDAFLKLFCYCVL